MKVGDAGRRVGVRGVVDLEVDDVLFGDAGLDEAVKDALGPLTAAGLAHETPHEDLVAGLQAAALDGLLGQVGAGLVEHGADVAGARGRMRRLGLRRARCS